MSDLSIPGGARKIDTKPMVDAVMEPDRARLKRKEQELQQIRDQKTIWQDVRQRLSQVETSARGLYSFQNPFREKTASSGDSSVLTATATREAGLESHNIRVLQMARADRFQSDQLERDFHAPAGTYRFRVGEDEALVNFRGGSLGELVDAINRAAGKLVQARVVKATDSSQVLLIEAKKTGAANALTLLDAAADLGLKAGLLTQTGRQLSTPALAPESLASLPVPDKVVFRNGAMDLKPGAQATLPFPGGRALSSEIQLEVRLRVSSLPEEAYKAPSPPAGPRLPSSGRGEFDGHSVENEPFDTMMPPWKPPEAPRRVDDLRVMSATSGGQSIELPAIEPRDGEQTWRVGIGKLTGSLDALAFSNRNTNREILIEEVRLVDPTVRGDFRPKNPISQAADAVVDMDGIKVTRGGNQIDDLLPGVSFTLHGESPKPVSLDVRTNTEAIKNALIQFVGYYNQLLGQVDVLTRTDEQVLSDIAYLNDDDRKKARAQLGTLQGDLTLNQMKGRLRDTLAGAYPTSAGRELALLVQMGIGTDTGRPGSAGIEKSRLRGYLEIDEAKLENAIQSRIEAVRELFGNDTDGDFVVDTGLAFAVAEGIKPYTQSGGVVMNRMAAIDVTAKGRERDIATLTRQLDDKEARLKRDFANMEGALNTLDRSSRALNNFSNGLGGGQR